MGEADSRSTQTKESGWCQTRRVVQRLFLGTDGKEPVHVIWEVTRARLLFGIRDRDERQGRMDSRVKWNGGWWSTPVQRSKRAGRFPKRGGVR